MVFGVWCLVFGAGVWCRFVCLGGTYYGILLFMALLGACDVIQDDRHIGRHLGFYRKLETVKKKR